MAKLESTFRNMVLVLFGVSLISAAALGVVYELTKEPIRLVDINKQNAAIQSVLPEFNNVPSEEAFKVAADGDSLVFFPAMKDSVNIGTAVETYTMKGFSGKIRLMVGFDPDGKIIRTSVIEHNETPGLGDKIDRRKGDFSLQFDGKDPAEFKLKVVKDRGDVDAITASTISSRAYCDAVQRAYDAYMAQKNNNK